jgi:rod shape-determining protein MreD
MNHSFGQFIRFVLSIILALALTILPFSPTMQWIMPSWVLLVLAFWLLADPGGVNLGVVWVVGIILLDLITGAPLGQHTIPLLISAYFFIKSNARLRIFPLAQQMVMVALFFGIYFGLQYWLVHWSNSGSLSWRSFFPLLTTLLVWPFVHWLLQRHSARLRKW